jgi:hypothetical protein
MTLRKVRARKEALRKSLGEEPTEAIGKVLTSGCSRRLENSGPRLSQGTEGTPDLFANVEALLSHRFVIFVITQELLKEQLPSAEARVSTQMRSMTLHHGVSPISNTNHTGSSPTDMQLVGMQHLLGCHGANRSSSSCPPMKRLQRGSDSSVQEVTNSKVAP